MLQLHHKLNLGLVVATPLAVLYSNLPLDLILNVALPLHGHIGMNMIATDYTKKVLGKGFDRPVRMGLAGLTTLTVLGLARLNLQGPGITESFKSFWYPRE